jgi:hypothetical protein
MDRNEETGFGGDLFRASPHFVNSLAVNVRLAARFRHSVKDAGFGHASELSVFGMKG